MKMINPLVSVCMITYGHEFYIEQAINGVLSQQVDFDYELIISNDNSPDNSDSKIRNIIRNNPNGNRIKYIKHLKNIGAIPNFHFSFMEAKGKYLAICEGDDYWSDPFKLQKQVSFLENNLDFAASFHDVEILLNEKIISFAKYHNNPLKEIMLFNDVVSNDWLIPTCSFVFRKDALNLPDFYDNLTHGDFPLFCGILLNSKARYFAESMGVYRRNNNSSLMNTSKAFGYLNVSLDFVQYLTWLGNFANEEDKTVIEERIFREIKAARHHINVYKNSKIFRLYSFFKNKLR